MSNLSTEILRQALDQLISERYINEKGTITERGLMLLSPNPLINGTLPVPVEIPKNNALQVIKLQQNWQLGFMDFIMEAKVPKYCDNGKGDQYIVNNYSEPAMKVFRKAIEKEDVIYDVLVKSTMLYYKSTKNRFKKAIANYFVQGDWRSDYKALLEAAGTGTVENHIKSEMNNGNKGHWKLG